MADLYMRQYHFPKAVETCKRKLEKLLAEAEELRADDVLNCLKAANEAWEREVQVALLQQQIRRERGK